MVKKSSASRGTGEVLSPTHFEVTLPANINTLSPAVSWVMRLVGDMECAAGKEFEIEMALREALANAIVHGCKTDPSKKIECCVTGDKERGILIVVRDPGEGFDLSKLPSPTDAQNVFADHGRGIYLIHTLMDEVQYKRNGAEIHMRRY